MRLLSTAPSLGLAGLLLAGIAGSNAAAAHSVSVSSIHSSHSYGGHKYSYGHGSHGGFFSSLFGFHLHDSYASNVVSVRLANASFYTLPPDSYGYAQVTRPPELAVPDESQRYKIATGKALPSAHGLIVVAPAGPHADSTYIWGSSKAS